MLAKCPLSFTSKYLLGSDPQLTRTTVVNREIVCFGNTVGEKAHNLRRSKKAPAVAGKDL
jgi:hypothetical protein